MKTSNLVFLTVLLSSSVLFSTLPYDYKNNNNLIPAQQVFMQVNNINTVFRTDGIFNLDKETFPGGGAGLIWPVASVSRKTVDYATGIWIGAKVGPQRELRLAACFYNSHYSPGNIPVIGQPPPSSVCSDPAWRGYLVNLVDQLLTNGGVRTKNAGGRVYTFTYDSWANWPVQKGAPYVEVNNIPGYQPGWNSDRPGIGHTTARPDEISFMVYMDYTNCTNSMHASEISLPGGTIPLGVEIQQLSFAFFTPGLTDMYFMKWKIINRSSLQWDSTYISIVDDGDVGDASDDRAGCDSTKQLGFIYNGDNYDPVYNNTPPAIGYKLLECPMNYTGNNQDTAHLPYGNFAGYRLLKMSGYNVFKNSVNPCYGDPDNAPAAYNFMRGKDGCGNTIYNPVTGNPTGFKYNHSCSPSGWYDSVSADKRQILSTGPLTINSGSERMFVAAVIVGSGTDYLQSLCNLFDNSTNAGNFYQQSFGGNPIGINQLSSEVPEKFALYQNYPNPFNPSTKIKFEIPLLRGVDGAKGDRRGVLLRVYDILGREITTLVNEELKPGTYEVDWLAENYPSGVYFYTIKTQNFFDSKKMILLK